MVDVLFDTDMVLDDYGVMECRLVGELHTHSTWMVANLLLDQGTLSAPFCHNQIVILVEHGKQGADAIKNRAEAIAKKAEMDLSFSDMHNPPSPHHFELALDWLIRRRFAMNAVITPFVDSFLFCAPAAIQKRGFVPSVSYTLRCFLSSRLSFMLSLSVSIQRCLPLHLPLPVGAVALSLLTGEECTVRRTITASQIPLTARQRRSQEMGYEHFLPRDAKSCQCFLRDYYNVAVECKGTFVEVEEDVLPLEVFCRGFVRCDKQTESHAQSVARSFSREIERLPFVTSSSPVRLKSGFVSSHDECLFERVEWEGHLEEKWERDLEEKWERDEEQRKRTLSSTTHPKKLRIA